MFRLVMLNFWLRHLSKRYLRREPSFARARAGMEAAARTLPMPRDARLGERPLAHGGRRVPALRVLAAAPVAGAPGAPLLLWIHGGAYCLGSPRTHAAMVAALARRIGGPAVLPGYRLAPEHPFPAAVEDVEAAWRGLLGEGVAPGDVVLGGDSAGGGLAFGLLARLLAEGGPLPRAVVAFSPWVDLTASGDSLRTLAGRDVMLPAERFGEIAGAYLAGADPADPRASPLFARYRGAPPVLILSSRHEVLRDDARRMAARLREDGVRIRHDEWDSVPHVWPLFQGRIGEADAALDRVAAFVRKVPAPEDRAVAGAGAR